MDDGIDGIQAKIVEIEQRSKSNTHRINDLEEDNRALHQLATSVEVLATKQETIEANISEIKDDVKSLKAIPGGKWEALVKAALTAIVGAGANIVIKESDTALTTIVVNPSSKTVHMYDGTTQDPIILRGIADPQTDTDAVSKKWIENTYGTMDAANATFAFPVVSRVRNVAGVVEDLDAANKYYVDQRVQYATHTIHDVSIDANGTHSEQVSVQLPTGITSVSYDFYVSVNGQNLMALCSATRTEAVSSSSGSWLRVHCLAYNPSSDAISGDIVIHVLCVHK